MLEKVVLPLLETTLELLRLPLRWAVLGFFDVLEWCAKWTR